MSKLIALRSGFIDQVSRSLYSDLSSKLKQNSLLFDQIGILGLGQFFESVDTYRNDPEFPKGFLVNKLEPIANEIQWLIENDIVFELTMEKELGEEASKNFFSIVNSRNSVEELVKLSTKLVEKSKTDITNIRNKTDLIDFLKANDAIVLRLIALMMETTKGITAVTTLPHEKYTRELSNSNKSNIAQIVINKLPMPNDETPWEQIIDYQNDSETQKHILSLRRWISKTSKQNLPPLEIEEEIESLINDFQEHMKLHKMKANTETVEVLVKLLPETIENLIKLKFSKLPEPLFVFKIRQINLMEAELNAPGRELSYIIKTRDAFQSDE